jgi:ABC-type branched-subunit amino acid transport system ATPase component
MLELKSVKKSFGGINVFKSLDFSLGKGDRVGLTGGNGTGKSTLINLATGFLLPDEGEIRFGFTSFLGLKPWQIARLGVRRNFQSVRLSNSLILRDQFFVSKQRVLDNLEMIKVSGIKEFLDRFPSECPLPILRKMEVLRALLSYPSILFLDEPSAGFSQIELQEFAQFLLKYVPTRTSLVIVEHRTELMELVCTKTWGLFYNEPLRIM